MILEAKHQLWLGHEIHGLQLGSAITRAGPSHHPHKVSHQIRNYRTNLRGTAHGVYLYYETRCRLKGP